MGDRLELVLSNELSELERLAAVVDDFVERNDLAPAIAFKLNLCFDELITNIMSYGYGDGAQTHHDIRIRLETDGVEVRAEVEDDSAPYDPFVEAPAPDLGDDIDERRIGGLGVFLVKKMMNRVAYRREGDRNLIQLAIHAAPVLPS